MEADDFETGMQGKQRYQVTAVGIHCAAIDVSEEAMEIASTIGGMEFYVAIVYGCPLNNNDTTPSFCDSVTGYRL